MARARVVGARTARALVASVAVLALEACGLLGDHGPKAPKDCVPTHHGLEVCDGIDNDCNGSIDEGAKCANGYSCVAGSCACPTVTCGAPPACVDTAKDTSNCGGCGIKCKPGEVCDGGHCICPLPKGPVCGGKCIDLDTDPNNCGACDRKCPVKGSICDRGTCRCPEDKIECDGECIDPKTNRSHCGSCGVKCDVACSGSKCVVASQVAAGGTHSCVRLEDGAVRCWGGDDSLEVGDGSSGDVNYPLKTGVYSSSEIAAGAHHTCALVGGKVVCWGSNVFGQIGDGTTDRASSPTQTKELVDATAIALGDTHSCARRASASVVCWGSNAQGELGDGSTTERHEPVAVAGLSNISAIALGAHHSCALRADGTVSCWGSNRYGELGEGPGRDFRATPATVAGLSSIVAIRAGGAHTCAIDSSSQVRCWGASDNQELGVTGLVPMPRVMGPGSDVTLGSGHACTLVSGWVRCVGVAVAASSPVEPGLSGLSAGAFHTCALNATRGVVCWGSNARGQCAHTGWLVSPEHTVEF